MNVTTERLDEILATDILLEEDKEIESLIPELPIVPDAPETKAWTFPVGEPIFIISNAIEETFVAAASVIAWPSCFLIPGSTDAPKPLSWSPFSFP